MVVALRYALRIESVGSDNVGSRAEITAVNVADDVGAGNVQHVVVALEQPRHAGEAFSTEVVFVKSILLNDGPHSTV